MSILLEPELPKNEEPNDLSARAIETGWPAVEPSAVLMWTIVSTGWPAFCEDQKIR